MTKRSEFDDIFRQYHSALYFFARQYVDDEEECRDIVTAAFERLWSNFKSVSAESAKSFLYVATRNLCIDYARHRSRQRAYVRYCETMTREVADNTDLMEHEERLRQIASRIARLQQPTRDIFVACYVERKKYKEVGQERGISVSTVKKHIVRALRIMRESRHIAE